MILSIQALRAQRVDIANKMKALVEDKSSWSDEKQASFNAMNTDIDRIDQQIIAVERTLEIEAGAARDDRRAASDHGVSVENASELRREILVSFLRDGKEGIRALERSGRIQNQQTAGTGSQGGYTVERTMYDQIVAAMKLIGGVRPVATVLPTVNGAPLDFPTADSTAEEGDILGEAATAPVLDTVFGLATMGGYKFTSKTIALSLELLQDSAVDIESYVVGLLSNRLSRGQNRYFTLGTGVNQPRGVVTAASVGKVGATGQTTAVLYDDLVGLEHSVDPAYRANARWMLHDQSLLKLKQIKDTTGRPIWLPGIALGAPDSLLGYGFQVNQHMAQMAANAKPILFGDFSKYLIRDVIGMLLYRNADSKYNEQGLVGFHAIARADGNLVDVGGAIKAYQNSAT